MTDRQETCARCGHQTPTCTKCELRWPFLGALINDEPYCHTFVNFDDVMGDGRGLTCYELSSREQSLQWLLRQPESANSWVRTREIRDVYGDGTDVVALLVGLEAIQRRFPEVTE